MSATSTINRGASNAAPPAPSHLLQGNRLTRTAVPLALLAVLGLVTGCSQVDRTERALAAEPRVVPAPAVRPAPTPEDLATPLRTGTVQLNEGVFTDTLRLDRATLTPGRRPEVAARLGNLVDAAPLLHLEVRALFFDRSGRYLGEGRYVERGHGEDDHGQDAEAHDGEQYDVLPVQITVDAPLPRAATSARLEVVQFVTE